MLVLYYDVIFAIFKKKPIPAIEDNQHYPCPNSCFAIRCMKYCYAILSKLLILSQGAQWLSGRVLDSRPRGRGFETHQHHCVVVLEQDTFILAENFFNPGRPVPVYLKDC